MALWEEAAAAAGDSDAESFGQPVSTRWHRVTVHLLESSDKQSAILHLTDTLKACRVWRSPGKRQDADGMGVAPTAARKQKPAAKGYKRPPPAKSGQCTFFLNAAVALHSLQRTE